MNLRQAKVFPREMTEEEKAEALAAAAATGKGAKQQAAPAKDAKKGVIEEPSKEEQERVEREKREKEERERKRQEEWDALDEETKFYRAHEDIYKQPCIKFQNQIAQKRIEQIQQQLPSFAPDSEEYKDVQAQL